MNDLAGADIPKKEGPYNVPKAGPCFLLERLMVSGMLDSGAGGVGQSCFGRGTGCGVRGQAGVSTARAIPPLPRKFQVSVRRSVLARADFQKMFQLLKQLDFNTVMFWPLLETVPAPLSQADRDAVRARFRPIIDDAHKCGLEVWLVSCVLTSSPKIAAKPWKKRTVGECEFLSDGQMAVLRMDRPQEAEAYLRHRAALLGILNDADGYVLIDGDPGSYPGQNQQTT